MSASVDAPAVLVTGAAGFIGSHVVAALLESGDRVVGVDRSWPGTVDLVAGAPAADPDRFVRIEGEVTDFPLLLRAASSHDVDRVIHLAAELHARSADNPGQCIQSNVVGTHHALELGRVLGLARVVTASSAALFGPAARFEGRVPNDAALVAGDVYEASKIFGEAEGAHYTKAFGVDHAAIRVGLAYGWGCTRGMAARIMEEIVEKPLRGQPGTIPFRDSQMNWTYAPDAAGAFVAAARAKGSPDGTQAFNLRGDPRTMAETAQAARDLIPGAQIEVEPGEHPWAQDFDDTALRDEIGFTSTWTLAAGLADLVEHHRRAR